MKYKWKARLYDAEATYVLNTYRVLLTRARYETVIWVPPGSRRDDAFHDPTRDAAELDEVARFLAACGTRLLEDSQTLDHAVPAPALL